MNIGSWRAVLKLSEKLRVSSSKFFRESADHDESVTALPMALPLLTSIMLTSLLLTPVTAHAGYLNGGYRSLPKVGDYYDWEYAKRVWTQMNTWDKEEAEWAKYAADADPWIAMYRKNHREALQVLKGYPEAKRQRIQRAFDIQLAADDWSDNVHGEWYRNYYQRLMQDRRRKGTSVENKIHDAVTFDAHMAKFKTGHCDAGANYLSQCGSVPDWRDAKMRKQDQQMMDNAASCVACQEKAADMKLRDTDYNKMCRPVCAEFWPKPNPGLKH